jgi:hypothetical protein
LVRLLGEVRADILQCPLLQLGCGHTSPAD